MMAPTVPLHLQIDHTKIIIIMGLVCSDNCNVIANLLGVLWLYYLQVHSYQL